MKRKLRLSSKDRMALDEFCERVRVLLGSDLKKLALFGSKADGTDNAESDIDVLVLIKDSAMKRRREIRDVAFDVNLKYNLYLSPRIIPSSVFKHPVWSFTPFIKGLKQRSIPL